MKKLILGIFVIFCINTLANELEECENGNMRACEEIKEIFDKTKQICDKNGMIIFCSIVGNAYQDGINQHLEINYKKASEYYTKACNGNIDTSMAWWRENGNPNLTPTKVRNLIVEGKLLSCNKLAWLYYNGKGVRKDDKKAFDLYSKVCHSKYQCESEDCNVLTAGACGIVGSLYHNGEGVRKDLSKAKEYYGKACDLGDQELCDIHKQLVESGVK